MTLSRRAFVRATGLAGILAAARPPAAWSARELTMLTAVNYAPTSDVKLAELGRRFTKATGVTVRMDHMQSVQMPAKLSSDDIERSLTRDPNRDRFVSQLFDAADRPRYSINAWPRSGGFAFCPGERENEAKTRRALRLPKKQHRRSNQWIPKS